MWRRAKRDRAFTLIELAIVIIVVGVLASIAIVWFSDLGEDSKWSEGKAMLSAVRKKLRLYIAREGGLGEINHGVEGDNLAWNQFHQEIELSADDFGRLKYFDESNLELDIALVGPDDDVVYTLRLGGAGSGIGTAKAGAPSGTLELTHDGQFIGP